jgi:hypothetical protein
MLPVIAQVAVRGTRTISLCTIAPTSAWQHLAGCIDIVQGQHCHLLDLVVQSGGCPLHLVPLAGRLATKQVERHALRQQALRLLPANHSVEARMCVRAPG